MMYRMQLTEAGAEAVVSWNEVRRLEGYKVARRFFDRAKPEAIAAVVRAAVLTGVAPWEVIMRAAERQVARRERRA